MESRKIIKFGKSSYVVTLPLNFIKKNNLDNESTILICEKDDYVKIMVDKKKEEKIAELTFDHKPLKLLNREIISYYLKNYSYIRISGKNVIERLEEIKILKEKLSSIEIVELSNESVLLKDLSSPSNLNVLKLLGEIVEMEKILLDEVINSGRENKHFLISSLDTNINKLSFLTFKTINYNLDLGEDSDYMRDCIHYWRITTSLENIGDIMKRLSRYIGDASEEKNILIKGSLKDLKDYFSFITSLIEPNTNVNNNLRVHLDKKQSLLRSFEELRSNAGENLNFYLLVIQLLKDILGQLDNIVLSVIDLNTK